MEDPKNKELILELTTILEKISVRVASFDIQLALDISGKVSNNDVKVKVY